MIPSTTSRVQEHTDETINQAIRRRTEQSIHYYAGEGRSRLNDRLMELEYEWDMERVLEANAAGASLIGLGLGWSAGRRWFILPGSLRGFSATCRPRLVPAGRAVSATGFPYGE